MRVRTHRARTSVRLTTTLALCLLAVVGFAPPALANRCDGEGGVDDDGGQVRGVCVTEHPGNPGSTTERERIWNRWCGPEMAEEAGEYKEGNWVEFYWVAELDEDEIEMMGLNQERQYSWYEVFCWADGIPHGDYTIIIDETPGTPETEARDEARARIDLPQPTPDTSPPVGSPAFVNVPVWLWLEPTYWTPIQISETTGTTTVFVRATPVRASWRMGDGTTVACDGPGTPWVSGMPETGSNCRHTYERSSYGEPEGRFQGSLAVRWEFSWWLNGVYRGVFGSVDMSSDLLVEVGEIQAIERRNR